MGAIRFITKCFMLLSLSNHWKIIDWKRKEVMNRNINLNKEGGEKAWEAFIKEVMSGGSSIIGMESLTGRAHDQKKRLMLRSCLN